MATGVEQAIISAAGSWTTGRRLLHNELPDEYINRRIRERAYLIWESNGRPEGRSQLYWDIAREEIRGF